MRILCVNQFFWPDTAPTGRLLADLCRELAARGHEVTVVCGRRDYSGAAPSARPPVRILRVPSLSFSRHAAARLLSWGSFLLSSTLRSLALPRFDLVLTMTTPPGLSFVGLLLQKLKGSQHWIWEMDLYPDVAIAAGTLRADSRVSRILSRLFDLPRRHATGLIALGECMRERLLAKGLPAARIAVQENWPEPISARPLPPSPPIRVLYSGNLGHAHEIETVKRVLVALRDDNRLRFVFAGSGPLRAALQQFCTRQALGNVTFLPHASLDGFSSQLADAHIGLVTLRPSCLGTVVPSKFYSTLAAGRPVLYIGPPESTPARHIATSGCGWAFEPGDSLGVVDLLYQVADDAAQLDTAARHAVQLHAERLQAGLALRALAGRLAKRRFWPAQSTTAVPALPTDGPARADL